MQASDRSPKARLLDLSEALRAYARDRVLLCGAPGSGKSTALVRLLLELAETARENTDSTVKIPVLVKLRLYRESVIDLLLGELARHGLSLSVEELTQQLQAGRFFLLFDDVEALPTEAAQQDLWEFLDRYHTMPTVLAMQDFPTQREFGIEKKLTVQRLRTSQASDFIEEYFPEIAAQLLPQLYGRSQEFAETPLQLQMLCVAFDRLRAVPENLGQMLRAFARYDDEQTDESEREAGNRLLKQLASQSLEGDGLTARTRVMSRQQVLIGFAECFREVGVSESQEAATSWLNRFLRHRLLREPVDGQIEFRHSLLQSYFAAEVLLERLPHLSDEVLTRDYLNFLKWTEPMVLALGLLEDEALAVRVVWLAFVQVDWMLGARLAGAVREPFQAQIVRSIAEWECSSEGSIELLKTTKSVAAVPFLQDYLNSQSLNVSGRAALALGEISSNASILALNETLDSPQWSSRSREAVVKSLQKLARRAGEAETRTLLEMLPAPDRVRKDVVKEVAKSAIENIESHAAIPPLLDAVLNWETKLTATRDRKVVLQDCWVALSALGNIGSSAAVNTLIQIFNIKFQEDIDLTNNSTIIDSTISVLGKIESQLAVNALCEFLNYENIFFGLRNQILKQLGNSYAKSAIPILLDLLDRESSYVDKLCVIEALQKIGSDSVVPQLVDKLQYPILPDFHQEMTLEKAFQEFLKRGPYVLHWAIVSTLGKMGNESAIPSLVRILNDRNLLERVNSLDTSIFGQEALYVKECIRFGFKDDILRKEAASTLGDIGSDIAVPDLINALNEEDAKFRKVVINALAKIGSQEAVNVLLDICNNKKSEDRQVAIRALREVKNKAAIETLTTALNHEDSQVRRNVALALGEIRENSTADSLLSSLNREEKNQDNRSISDLIDDLNRAFDAENSYLCREIIKKLGNIGDDRVVSSFLDFLDLDDYQYLRSDLIEVLGKIGDNRAVSAIVRALHDEETCLDCEDESSYDYCCDVFESSIKALENIGSDAAVEALIDLFKDEEGLSRDKGFYSRDRVAEALGNVGGDAAASVLTYSLEEEDFEIFESASNALRKCAKGYHLPEINQHTDLLFSNSSLFEMLAAIQQRCGYYRHELFREKQALLQ
ncbi:HEAT repeat domain-containing protein [Geitlerinema sp. CS-897]|nr:HEAT repeat domain-containing protein [Geitlerinema sp. CS-897]